MHGLTRQITVASAVFIMIVLNLFPEVFIALVGANEPREFPIPMIPAGYTFLIWAPIFIGCAALAVYQAQPAQRNDSRFDLLAWPVILICFFNTLTRFIPIGLSIIIFASLLFSLAWAFLTTYHMGPQDQTFYWTTRIPLTIFFAWATVATVVNVGQVLSRLNWTGFGIAATTWIAILLVVATLIGVFVSVRYREVAYGMVFIWAFWGIVAAQNGAITVITSAIVCTIALGALIGWLLLSGRSGDNQVGPSTT